MLLDMTEEHAAQVLAVDPDPPARTPRSKPLRPSGPKRPGRNWEMLWVEPCGQRPLWTPQNAGAAASILVTMPASEAARILRRADVRTARGSAYGMASRGRSQVSQRRETKRAAEVLEYVNPVTVAALLTSLNGSEQWLAGATDPLIPRACHAPSASPHGLVGRSWHRPVSC